MTLTERVSNGRGRESRSSIRPLVSRNEVISKKYQSMQKNHNDAVLPHNPITNPIDMYNVNPYAHNARKQVLNHSSKISLF